MNHACRYCYRFDCAERYDHDRWHRSSETTARMPLAEQFACPQCGGDVRSDFCPARPTVASLRRAA